MNKKNVLIMGAAGRDFHNFNTYFKDNSEYRVVAFTATQIPGIENRVYPPSLAGKLYANGIPIYPESKLLEIIALEDIDQVIFSYSDVSHTQVMNIASSILASGADFRLLGPKHTMIKSAVPIISVTAVRTGSGKSQTSKYIAQILKNLGKRVVVVRHPMPYGDLEQQSVQRFQTYDDMKKHNCTIEEREEYEAYIDEGIVVYAGVDYDAILKRAEDECDVILWDGGNNDLPFYKSDIHITIADPLRLGDESNFYPGESNVKMAHIVLINKVNSAKESDVDALKKSIKALNSSASVVLARSLVSLDSNKDSLKGKSLLVVEDGPSLTHGGMGYGAGLIATENIEGVSIIDPREFAVGSIAEVFSNHAHIGSVLPAMGYSEKQICELQQTINSSSADIVVIGTPIDLNRFIDIEKPTVRVSYSLEEVEPLLEKYLLDFFQTSS